MNGLIKRLSPGIKLLLGAIVGGAIYLTAIQRLESTEFVTIAMAIILIARELTGLDNPPPPTT